MVDDSDVSGQATVEQTLAPSTARAPAIVELPEAGYELGAVIGRGGMGEVVAARDKRIGREVAIKRMTGPTPDAEQLSRFLREARIQARLDHPAVVPVHELATDEDGRPYFTMKRLSGVTLAFRIADGAAQNRLLRAFVEVCNAVEFAHAHGVVHRDLKPSNIMLGDYGEVYVIDWGIARVIAEQQLETFKVDIDTLAEGTESGALLGTPGFMAPEQLRGLHATPAADIYALGAILFELLAGESLHTRGHAAIASTLSTPQVAPSARAPQRPIPPELDVLCFRALDEDPTKRPSAHELAEGIQHYLDGDRDLAQRRRLAAQQLAQARVALANEEPDARATAMRRAGRALALDPESEEAAAIVGALLLEPPVTMPPDLERSLEEHERQISRDRSRKALLAYSSLIVLLPVLFFLDVKEWTPLIGFYGVVAIAMFTSWRSSITGDLRVGVALVTTLALAVLFTRIAGPFVLTPLLVCCALVALTPLPWLNERTWAVVGWTAAALALPLVFEATGILPSTWSLGEAGMVMTSDLVRPHGAADAVSLVVANSVFTLVVALLTLGISRRRRIAQRQIYVQAWHLRQLLPTARR
jgi:serine/threonine-protein kinase